jgi:hypothetical protein
MKTALRIVLAALVAAGLGLAQEKCSVDPGHVKDDAGQPLGAVKITFKSSLGTQSLSTNKQGVYSGTVLCSENSKHTLTPSKAGYVFQPSWASWHKYSGSPSFTGRKTSQK